MVTFEQFMNYAVPIVIVLLFGGMMYVKLKKPIDQVLAWIKELFGWGKNQLTTATAKSYEIVYR